MRFFLSSADYFQNHLLKRSFSNTVRVSNCLDPDQDRRSVGPDLCPNCLQMLSIDDKRYIASHQVPKRRSEKGHQGIHHTGQCKSTGSCYNELVVAIFRTGAPTGKCICRFAGIYAYCRYFRDRKW